MEIPSWVCLSPALHKYYTDRYIHNTATQVKIIARSLGLFSRAQKILEVSLIPVL